MREDIKRKFLDILFEPEEVERHEKVVAKAPLEDVKPKRQRVSKEEINTKPQVEVKKTAFINIDNKPKEEIDIEVTQIKEKVNNKDYEFTQNISPIFGVVNGPKKPSEPKVMTDDSQTAKPSSSYLGTIISPIFGYDANKSTKTFEEYKEEMDGLKGNGNSLDEKQDPFDDTLSINVETFRQELEDIGEQVANEEPVNEEHTEQEVVEDKIDDVVNIEPEDEYYSPDDEQLFKELSISDIFKTEEEVKENKEEEDKKVSYTSLFDNKED